jgi:hypothetical protein
MKKVFVLLPLFHFPAGLGQNITPCPEIWEIPGLIIRELAGYITKNNKLTLL